MFSSNLQSKLEVLKTELEKEQQELQDLAKQKDEVFSSDERARKSLIIKKEDAESFRVEKDTLYDELKDQEDKLLMPLQAELEEKEREKKSVLIQIEALENVLRPLREQQRKYNKLLEEERLLESSYKLLYASKKALLNTPTNYKVYVDRGNPAFPIKGTLEEKLEWAKSFGKFAEEFNRA